MSDYYGSYTPTPMSPAMLQHQQMMHQQHSDAYANGQYNGQYHEYANNAYAAQQQHNYGMNMAASFGSQSSQVSTPTVTSNPASTKRYSHNPYASSTASSEPSSPALAPTASFGADGMPTSYAHQLPPSALQAQGQGPVYAPEAAYSDATSHPVAYTVNEQFAAVRGNIPSAACTARGRHVLISVMRQQHTDKIQAIFEEVAPNLQALILDTNGLHVVRTMIEFLDAAQVSALCDCMSEDTVLALATSSQHTRRVIQMLFERHRCPALQRVVDVIATHAIALSTTQQGCIAVMRVIENSTEPQRLQVLYALKPQLAALTMDPFGNYVVQSIIQHYPRDTVCDVIEKSFAGHWVQLSCNKFASNVMEKVVQACNPITRKVVLEELVHHVEHLQALMQDGFGNFVLQQIIDTCTTGPEYRTLVEKIKPHLATSPFGHKIEAKLKSKRFGPPYVSTNSHNHGERNAERSSHGGRGNGNRHGNNNNNHGNSSNSNHQQGSGSHSSASSQQGRSSSAASAASGSSAATH